MDIPPRQVTTPAGQGCGKRVLFHMYLVIKSQIHILHRPRFRQGQGLLPPRRKICAPSGTGNAKAHFVCGRTKTLPCTPGQHIILLWIFNFSPTGGSSLRSRAPDKICRRAPAIRPGCRCARVPCPHAHRRVDIGIVVLIQFKFYHLHANIARVSWKYFYISAPNISQNHLSFPILVSITQKLPPGILTPGEVCYWVTILNP